MTSLEQNHAETHYQLRSCSSKEVHIAIAVAEWNNDITFALRDGALAALEASGVPTENIKVAYVPGAFELTYAAASFLQAETLYDAVIILGCVIRGETAHYDCICDGVSYGITSLNRNASAPVIFGLVTTENKQQALDRAGGKLGNKGTEAALTALKMIDFSCEINQ